MTTTSQSPNPPSRNFFTRKLFLILVVLVVLLCGGLLVFKWLKDNTTLSFNFLLDGKPLSVGMTPTVKVDGLPFTSGCTIAPGSHELTAELPNVESFALRVRVLYGNKNLGDLTLESSKGSLLVSVNPSPASVIVRRGTEAIGKGEAPLTLEKLFFGEYELEIRHGEYKETHSVKVQGKQRTEKKIDLNLGGVNLSSVPADAEFQLSGNGQFWDGKLPALIKNVPVGDYSVVVRRGEYEERHSVNIQRQQLTESKIELNLGSVSLSSDPADAEFDLSGNRRHWQGKLPMRIDDVPVGNYSLLARRKGWETNADVSVVRGITATNKVEFPYGSIEVTSEPTGLTVSTNGVEIGKTPLTLREMKPGKYALSATDGENDLMASVTFGPKEAAKQVFNFRYGSVQLSSTPPGAIVIRKGREVGKTPVKLERIPAGETAVELRLAGYVSTNFPLHVQEGATMDLAAKLISERYLQAMKQAHEAFDARQYDQSQKFLAAALEVEPNDSSAMRFRDEVSNAAKEADEKLRAEQAKEKERMIASLTWLDFRGAISDCTDTKQVQYQVTLADGYYEEYRDNNGKKRTRFRQTGTHTETRTRVDSTFNPTKFSENYRGRTFGFNCPDKWAVTEVDSSGNLVLKAGILASDKIIASPANAGGFGSLQKGEKVKIKGVLTKYDAGKLFQSPTIFLDQAEILTP